MAVIRRLRAPRGHDIVCLSHLRWDHVWQRPQQLLSMAAREHRVFFVEEPLRRRGTTRLRIATRRSGVTVVTPRVPSRLIGAARTELERHMLDALVERYDIVDPVLWFYTPMRLPVARDLQAAAVVYDCMDDLSRFRDAPPDFVRYERALLHRADLVFTGGYSLYEAKRRLRPNVHLFPSSVDVAHFARAREPRGEPADQRTIPHPRLGFFGVIDERMDLDLVAAVADARPDWQLVFVGPTTKIALSDRPRRPNIHYLGARHYEELPAYLSGWDVALIPFARNEATRFISPTKTPEYLAAGKPVVSTSIRDVVRPYGMAGLVRIADTPSDFVAACEAALHDDLGAHVARTDEYLAGMSWARTWSAMSTLVKRAIAQRDAREAVAAPTG